MHVPLCDFVVVLVSGFFAFRLVWLDVCLRGTLFAFVVVFVIWCLIDFDMLLLYLVYGMFVYAFILFYLVGVISCVVCDVSLPEYVYSDILVLIVNCMFDFMFLGILLD